MSLVQKIKPYQFDEVTENYDEKKKYNFVNLQSNQNIKFRTILRDATKVSISPFL